MIKQCGWCLKSFNVSGKRTKSKYCSRICRRERFCFNDKRSPFHLECKNRLEILKDSSKYVKCEMCGQLARRALGKHISTRHKISWGEYKIKYPDAKQNCLEISKYITNSQSGEKNWMWGLRYLDNSKFKNGWLAIKAEAVRQRGYKCEECGYDKYLEAIEAHHKQAKKDSGRNTLENCQLLCANCHKHHTVLNRAKALRQVKI
jgi:hypothetical protein